MGIPPELCCYQGHKIPSKVVKIEYKFFGSWKKKNIKIKFTSPFFSGEKKKCVEAIRVNSSEKRPWGVERDITERDVMRVAVHTQRVLDGLSNSLYRPQTKRLDWLMITHDVTQRRQNGPSVINSLNSFLFFSRLLSSHDGVAQDVRFLVYI
jgi:hypothetical protein